MKKLLAMALVCGAFACGNGSDASVFDGGNSSVQNGEAGIDASGVAPAPALGGDGGTPGSADGGTSASLTLTLRDFKFWNASDPSTNPDFENATGDDRGIVAATLGGDQKPVYKNPAGMTGTTHGKKFFDQWYNDVAGTNIALTYPLALTQKADGSYGYDSLVSGVPLSATDSTKMFFPIDDGTAYATAFGNQGHTHNYSFTTELHTVFVYKGGETFTFSGDDDVFVFINKSLVIDLGGVHPREDASLNVDSLGLTHGQQYPLDLFSAERHTTESNLSFTTTLNLQPPPR